MRRLQPRIGEGRLPLLGGQRGDFGDGRGELGSLTLDLGEVDAQPAAHPVLRQRGDATQPALGAAEEPPNAMGPAQVQMRVVFPGAADAAENLDAVPDVGLRGSDADTRGQRRGDGELVGLPGVRCGAGGVGGGHLGLLGAAEHLRAQVLDGLEATDRLAELLAHLGVGDGGLERPPCDAGRFGRQHRRGQLLDPLSRLGDRGRRRRRQHHPCQRPGKVGGLQRLHPNAVAAGVDQDPLPVRGQQQHRAVRGAQHEIDGARRLRRLAVELHVTLERQPGEALAGGERGQQFGIGDYQGRQRGGGDRPGHQRLGRLLDHRAQILDAAAGPAGLLGNGDAEQAEVGQTGEHRPPGVDLSLVPALLDLADCGGPTRPGGRVPGPVAHQLACRELFVSDGRYHLGPSACSIQRDH